MLPELDLDNQLSTMTGARQTMSSWARVIESFDEIPEVYRGSFKMEVGDAQLFPYTVLTPPIANFGRKTTEKLLCESGDIIRVWERRGSRVNLTAYPIQTVSDFEIGSILLYSWITISGVTKAGASSSTTVEFNTATSRHLEPFFNKLRPKPAHIDTDRQKAERAKFDYLGRENFKFMNFAHSALAGGETVLQILLQPRINKPIVKLGRRTLIQNTLTLTHLTILTDREFIIIQDDERSYENRGVRYGGKWHYIALKHIRAVSVQSRADDLLTLSLSLSPGKRRVDILFETSRRQELVQLQERIETLKG